MSKIRRILIPASEFAKYLQLRFHSPDDLEVVGCAMDDTCEAIVVKIRSNEFQDISDLTPQDVVYPSKSDIIHRWDTIE